MLLHDNRISMRLQKQILKNARRRTKELISKRNIPISLSAYLRELIKLDVDKKIL
jgi:hypothetical protein